MKIKYKCKRCGKAIAIKVPNCPECSSSDGFDIICVKMENELTTSEEEEIAELIKQGFTSGRVDTEYGEHKTRVNAHVAWELKVNRWED